jgi:hypothetical protein
MLSVVYPECRLCCVVYAVSFMLSVTSAECHYAECRYAECRYAECHYASPSWLILKRPIFSQFSLR